MTNSESILQFGPNGYSKPATALNILRETILGRELFDFAFKEYAQRWRFKRPMPADFFRTMEDASGVDLDWFWRGWFYSTDHVDLAITGVRQLNVSTSDPEIEKKIQREARDNEPKSLSKERNESLEDIRANRFPELKDFYNEYDQLDVTEADQKKYEQFLNSLDDDEKELLETEHKIYIIDFTNIGGLVMPIIFDVEFEDGSKEHVIIPAEIWSKDNEKTSRMFISEKSVVGITLDPKLETADVDLSNNFFPPRIPKSRFELFKQSRRRSNPMQQTQRGDGEDEDLDGEESKVEKKKVQEKKKPRKRSRKAEKKTAEKKGDE